MFTIYKMYMYKNVYRYNCFFPVSPSFYFSYIISGECLSDCCLTPTQQLFSYIMASTSSFSKKWWWGPLCTRVPDRNVTPLGHIILILSQPVFALSPKCCVLGGEATNTNFIVFGLTRLGLEPTIICTWEYANYYTTNAVHFRRRKELDANMYFRLKC